MNYLPLVNTILSHKIISEAIEELYSRVESLNLITAEWKETLENSEIYQKHCNGKVKYSKGYLVANEKAYNKKLKNSNDHYNIIVVGEWSLKKSKNNEYSVVARMCEPLRLIGLSMRENTDSILHDGGRFFIRECSVSFCDECQTKHAEFKVPLLSKNWCVKSLRIFNGKSIQHTFTKVLQQNLLKTGSFMGIFRMRIHSRTTYGDNCYKIGGIIEELIVFQHSILLPTILNLEKTNISLSLEYAVEVEEEDEENKA